MTDINTHHPLDLDAPRLSIRKPGVRCDKQGEMPDAERLQTALRNFIKDCSRPIATYMESCIHCGQCAQACHFYVASGDPKYTPIWKLEPFKQAYKREAGPFALFFKAFNLKLKKLDKSLTFHDPCQVSRRGGATQAPREVLKPLGVELREMPSSGEVNWCCGGGGGVVTIHRADPLRYKAFGIKMRQIDATGADMAVTSCANCRQTFDDGQAHFKWGRTMGSLRETVAANLAGHEQ